MLDYDTLALSSETELLSEWYWSLKKGAQISDDLLTEYQALWPPLIASLSTPHIVVLRDFHAENLLWLPERSGPAQTGVIDFQDGLYGHAAYDLVSLLEDARRDVSPQLAEAMLTRYIEHAHHFSDFDLDRLTNDYAILAAQRNAKILGIFARLAKRDNKPRYLDLLPRVEAHFRRDIARPGLEQLQSFFTRYMPEIFE